MLIVTFIIGPQDSYGNMHEEDDPNYELELANAKTYKREYTIVEYAHARALVQDAVDTMC